MILNPPISSPELTCRSIPRFWNILGLLLPLPSNPLCQMRLSSLRCMHSPSMGCGISGLNLVDDRMACGAFHPLKRRIDEIRGNNINPRPSVDGTASTKLLLKHGGDQADNHINDSVSRKSISLVRNNAVFINPLLTEEDDLNRREVEIKMVENGDEDLVLMRKEDEGGARISDYDGLSWIGSPSFREYCTMDSDTDDSFKDHDNEVGQKAEEKREETQNAVCSNEIADRHESRAKSTSKGRRQRRFKNVFPKRGPTVVKNLLNVTTCYNPNLSSKHDSSRKIPRKVI